MRKPIYPYQYEDSTSLYGYTEPGTDGSAHLDVDSLENVDLKRLMKETSVLNVSQTLGWIDSHREEFSSSSVIYDDKKPLIHQTDDKKKLIVLTSGLDEVTELNKLLNASSESLSEGGYLWVHTRTSGTRKESMMTTKPPVVRNIVFFFWYIWYRIFPKLTTTRWLYNLYEKLDGRINRCYHRVEILGRLFRSGFEVVDEGFRNAHFYVVCRKVKAPMYENEPTGSPIIKLMRVGKYGKIIPIFKFRTMHSYSEYLQGYVYRYNSLDKDGKFANDYRIAGYGKIMRKFWLDELPMIWNLLRGDVKIVGVRPISQQYYNLYSPEMQQLRIKVKPGIFPPFHYEKKKPETLPEIEESERRYTESYLKNPFITDWRYFWGTVGNILFRGTRSK